MIKVVIFDLDGVLVDLKECHYHSLNRALEIEDPIYSISLDDHLKFYDGLPTKEKLKMLTKYKSLPQSLYEKIQENKQRFTLEYIYENIDSTKNIFDTLSTLKEKGYKVCVASNSISSTIYAVLTKKKILHLVDFVVSNEDVKHPKPNPEIYFRAISRFGIKPDEAIIVEDSPYGLEAAYYSGANVIRVGSSKEVTVDLVFEEISLYKSRKFSPVWKDKKMNVLIPMAGAGSRFEAAGYTLPKPLIPVSGKPMIQRVVENLNVDANFIFLVQKKHDIEFGISAFLKSINPDCTIVTVDSLTEGAACTALLARRLIDTSESLIIVNSDQFIEWDSSRFYYQMSEKESVDGSILVFKSTHPKWSFARTGHDDLVVEVAEKNPISDNATVGFYYWRKGSDFVKYADEMIAKNARVNNEFYVAPVFNEAILDGKKISTFEVERMWGLGTPEDLNFFLENYRDL